MKQSKKNMKPIPSALRGKKRYILFSLNPEKRVFEGEVHHAVWNHFLEKFGSLGAARQRLVFAHFDSARATGIVRIAHTSVSEAKQALLEIKEIKGIQVKPQILRVSGTIRKLKQQK